MGTHIDVIIPKEKQYSIEELKLKLKDVYNRLQSDYLHIENNGTFTRKVNGNWWFKEVYSERDNTSYIMGEGDSFSIDICENVVIIGSIERFSSLYREERNIAQELYNIITELSNLFRSSRKMIIGMGGFGDTDEILDMVFERKAEFEALCEKMISLHGNPALNLYELTDKLWYLQE